MSNKEKLEIKDGVYGADGVQVQPYKWKTCSACEGDIFYIRIGTRCIKCASKDRSNDLL